MSSWQADVTRQLEGDRRWYRLLTFTNFQSHSWSGSTALETSLIIFTPTTLVINQLIEALIPRVREKGATPIDESWDFLENFSRCDHLSQAMSPRWAINRELRDCLNDKKPLSKYVISEILSKTDLEKDLYLTTILMDFFSPFSRKTVSQSQ